MSLEAVALDRELVRKLLELARLPWEPGELAAFFERQGWEWSEGYGFAVSKDLFVRPADPDMTDGLPGGAFFVDFCALEVDEEEDERERMAFDEVCRGAIDRVREALGVPRLAGRDENVQEAWLYALWDIEAVGKMVAVVQRDEMDAELGSLWIREWPAGEPAPKPGQVFIDWLYQVGA